MSKHKKNKIKKMKEKYGDQDEEERQMRMLLLGSKEVKDFDLQEHVETKNKFTGKGAKGGKGSGRGGAPKQEGDSPPVKRGRGKGNRGNK